MLTAFDPGVQSLDADELFESDDARPYLIADLVFPFIYGLAFSIAAWRFGRELIGGFPPWWIVAAVVALGAGAVFDLAENVLLLAAIEDESAGLVDAAHVVAVPKLVGAGIGDVLAVAILIRAVIELRRQRR